MKLYKILGICFVLLVLTIQSSYADSPLPNWYKGDQHVHTAFGRTLVELLQSPLPDMVNSAKNTYRLDWVVITDHSVDIYNAQEWQLGYDSCLAENTANFKCLYSQEMALDSTPPTFGAGDARHYLGYPYVSDNPISFEEVRDYGN